MVTFHNIVLFGGCVVCFMLGLAVFVVQYQPPRPLDVSWIQLVSLLAPIRLSTHSELESFARMQTNMTVLSNVIDSTKDLIPVYAYKEVARLRRQYLYFRFTIILSRLLLACGLRSLFSKIGFALVVRTYSRIPEGLLALHKAHHTARLGILVIAVGSS